MALHRLKSLHTAKEAVNKKKRQPIEWEKIFLHHSSDKELISNSIKNSSNSTENPLKKWAGELNRHFQKRHPSGQQVHIRKLYIPNHQGNTNQNHSEISPLTF